jgi:hypothetical protein
LPDNFGAELRYVAVHDPANHPFHNWFNPIARLHSCSETKLSGEEGA